MRKFLHALVAFAYLIAATPAPAGFIIDPFKFAVAVPTFSYRNSYQNTSNLSSYTFTAADLGTEHSLRVVVVGIINPGTAVTSVTVGGVSATVVNTSGSTSRVAELWQASVPTGATGDIVVNSPTTTASHISVWAGYPASATVVDSVGGNSSTGTVTLADVAKTSGGFVTCFSSNTSTQNGVITQNGVETVTENFDGPLEGSKGLIASSHISTATTTTDDYTTTYASGNIGFVCGSWGP